MESCHVKRSTQGFLLLLALTCFAASCISSPEIIWLKLKNILFTYYFLPCHVSLRLAGYMALVGLAPALKTKPDS